MKKILFLLLFISYSLSLFSKNTIYIVVHGTWAIEATWWQPRGDFYQMLKNRLEESDKLISFAWSGENNDSERHMAAARMFELIHSYYNRYEKIIVIAHSHGGNLVNLATQLAEQDYEFDWMWNENEDPLITTMYALGTPVHENYYPNMNVVGNFYNLFSHKDYVQPAFGIYGQTYPKQDNLANISLKINEQEPGHSEIHCTTLAKKLPYLHALLQKKRIEIQSSYLEGQLSLYDYKASQFTPRNETLNEKKWIENQYVYSTMLFQEDHDKLNEEKLHALENNLFENDLIIETYEW